MNLLPCLGSRCEPPLHSPTLLAHRGARRFEGANDTGNREALPPDEDVGSLYAGARQATQGSAYEAAAALQGVMGEGSQLLGR